jgi:hypothetical protein
MKLHAVFFIVLFVGSWLRLDAQSPRDIQIASTSEKIVLDGMLNEAVWQKAHKADDFWQYFPFDTSKSVSKSEVMMTYDEENIYAAIIVYDSLPGEYIAPSLRRDYRGGNIDGFSIVLDPFLDQTNGFFFGITPFGVRREGLISNGGNQGSDLSLSWDNMWYGESKIYEHYWIAEVAIPFNTIRFKEGTTTWGINFYRIDTKYNERAIWSRVPRPLNLFNLAYTGRLKWDKPVSTSGSNMSVIPYAAGGTNRNYLEETDWEGRLDAGGDAKIAITPSLNLDLTVNPDFSQVEVDEQQTNLDRFEIFFPERRQFFLENADLFAGFGFENARPFFSRRIGVAIDSATGQNVQNRILLGARLSGRLDKNWRVGVMNMQTARDDGINQPSYNYSVVAVQRQLFARSNISAIFVDKSNFDEQPVDVTSPQDGSSNKLFGLDYNLASADGKWSGKLYYHQTFDDNNGQSPFSHGASLQYNSLRFRAGWTHQIVGRDFDAKVGFVPRTDFRRINPEVGIIIYPNSQWINRHELTLSNDMLWNSTWGTTDNDLNLRYTINFQNTARFNFSLTNNYVKLFAPFNPIRDSDLDFQTGEDFSQSGFSASYRSDERKVFNYELRITNRAFFNGHLLRFSGELNYRYRQYATLALNFNINQVRLSEGYGEANIYLIGPRIDVTFSRTVFFTTFLQYNSQFDNINLNSRLQWRFRPVSDIFLVYTDNYFPEGLVPKNRALVFKATYWLNI